MQLQIAVKGLYSPRGYVSRCDYDIAFLVKALGGPRLLYTLSHAIGLPSNSALTRNYKVPTLLPSIATPTSDEIMQNISSMYDPEVKPLPTYTSGDSEKPGQIAMMDGVATDAVARLDAIRNCILGICREHSHLVNLEVNSYSDVQAVEKALYVEKVAHHASEATVVAIAPIVDIEHYTPVPIVCAPTCGAETGKEHAEWVLTRLLEAWKTHPQGEQSHGPIWTFATDDVAVYRLLRFLLFMIELLDPESKLGKILYELIGFDCWTGKGGIVRTCGAKHVIKHFATQLRSPCAIMVYRIVVLPSHVASHLSSAPGMMPEKVQDIMNPTDKQNVPKAVCHDQALQAAHSCLRVAPLPCCPRFGPDRQ